MAKIRIEPDRRGYAQVRQSAEVEDVLKSIAENAVQKCSQRSRGYQYKIKTYNSTKNGRPYGKFPTKIATIIARTKAAQKDNSENNTILKAVFGSDTKYVMSRHEIKINETVIKGHYRTLKDGRKIWVKGHSRKKTPKSGGKK